MSSLNYINPGTYKITKLTVATFYWSETATIQTECYALYKEHKQE